MIAKTAGWAKQAAPVGAASLLTLLLGLALLLLAATIAGAPPEHDIVPIGTHALKVRVVTSLAFPAISHVWGPVWGPIGPSTSLAFVRCAAWQEGHASGCPDEFALAKAYWPELTPEPATIYVGLLWPYCIASAPHFNVEYSGGVTSTNVTLHCHHTLPWAGGPSERGSNTAAPPSLQLILVPTAGMSAGPVWVYREDRTERWIQDDSQITLLGQVMIG